MKLWPDITFGLVVGVAGVCFLAAFLAEGSFEGPLSLVDVAQLALTIALAIWINGHLPQRLQRERVEQDLVIDQCRSALDIFAEVRKQFSQVHRSPGVPPSDLGQSLRALSNQLSTIAVYLELFGFEQNRGGQLLPRWMEYRKAVTEKGFPLRLSESSATAENAAAAGLSRAIVKVILDVNRNSWPGSK